MDLLTGIFAAFGLSASAGLNAYIPLLVVGLLAKFTDLITLSPPWNTLESWWIIGLLIILSLVEFVADKVPAVNHANDAIMTIIRPAAGAIVFAASAKVIDDIHPVLALSIGLLVAGSVHVAKSAAIRPAVTATTAGAGNVPVSVAEDALATVISILSVVMPILMTAVIILLVGWLLYRVFSRPSRRARV